MALFNKDKRLFRFIKLFNSAFRRYRLQIVIIAVLSFLSGVLEGFGINAIIPMFSLITGHPLTDTISQAIAKFFLFFHLSYTVKSLLGLMVFLFIIKAIILFFAHYTTTRITADYAKNMRSELFKAVLESDWSSLSKQKVGYLEQVLTTNINNSAALLSYIGGLILVASNFIVYSIIAINISFPIATLTLALGVGVFFLFKPLFYRNRVISSETVNKYKKLAHYVNENIIGIKTIKSVFVESSVIKKAQSYFERMKELDITVESLKILTNASMQPIGMIFIVGIFAFFYKTTDTFDFSSFAVIIYAINKIFGNIQIAQAQMHTMSSQIPHMMSVLAFKEHAVKHKEEDSGTRHFTFNDVLELRNIGFCYNENEPTLSSVSFSVKKGDMVGLIGPSGAGKTTLVDILLRLLNPKAGAVLLDGENIGDIYLGEWRNNIGYVSQDIFLMNDTIANNIKFYDESMTEEDMVQASITANIHEFIQTLPDGYNTVVGERGTRLSGGQRQRIVLARVLARRPCILILDEATSALDNESEVLIQKAIGKLKGTTTVIVIAHRLSTVMISDKLIVLENGKIIEEDSPHELLKKKDSYFFKTYNVRM